MYVRLMCVKKNWAIPPSIYLRSKLGRTSLDGTKKIVYTSITSIGFLPSSLTKSHMVQACGRILRRTGLRVASPPPPAEPTHLLVLGGRFAIQLFKGRLALSGSCRTASPGLENVSYNSVIGVHLPDVAEVTDGRSRIARRPAGTRFPHSKIWSVYS